MSGPRPPTGPWRALMVVRVSRGREVHVRTEGQKRYGITNEVATHLFADKIVTAAPGFNAGTGRHIRAQQASDWCVGGRDACAGPATCPCSLVSLTCSLDAVCLVCAGRATGKQNGKASLAVMTRARRSSSNNARHESTARVPRAVLAHVGPAAYLLFPSKSSRQRRQLPCATRGRHMFSPFHCQFA